MRAVLGCMNSYEGVQRRILQRLANCMRSLNAGHSTSAKRSIFGETKRKKNTAAAWPPSRITPNPLTLPLRVTRGAARNRNWTRHSGSSFCQIHSCDLKYLTESSSRSRRAEFRTLFKIARFVDFAFLWSKQVSIVFINTNHWKIAIFEKSFLGPINEFLIFFFRKRENTS